MKKMIFFMFVCLGLACKKNPNKKLLQNNWQIESATVTPALTVGTKTSTNYIDLMGPESCIAKMSISFADNGTFIRSSNGALCDMYEDFSIKTWRREGDQLFLSAFKEPLTLDGDKLTQTTTTTETAGQVYTFVFVYKAKSK